MIMRRLFSSAERAGADCAIIHLLVLDIMINRPAKTLLLARCLITLINPKKPHQLHGQNTHPGERFPVRHHHIEDMSPLMKCSQSDAGKTDIGRWLGAMKASRWLLQWGYAVSGPGNTGEQ